MTAYRRLYVPGASYFFTLVTQDRRPLLTTPEAVERLRCALRYVMERRTFKIDAMMILPDHVHAIWTLPDDDADFSERWRLVKYRFSLETPKTEERRPSHAHKRERGIWQRRFWEHCLRDEADYVRHCDYLHFNPVKHGLVECPREWPYSSFSRFVLNGIYPSDWGCAGEPAGMEIPNTE